MENQNEKKEKAEILLKIKSYIAKEFKINEDQIKEESSFCSLGLDSLDFWCFCMLIDEIEISIDTALLIDFSAYDSLGDITDRIYKLKKLCV